MKIPDRVIREGIRLGDSCLVEPAMGKRREIMFTRKNIKIRMDDSFNIHWDFHQLRLPSMKKNIFEWEFELIGDGDEARYFLKSQSSLEFYQNDIPIERGWPIRKGKLRFGYNLLTFSGESKAAVKTIINLPHELITSNIPILIEGETGTGKSILAKKLHEESGVVGDFIQLNLKSFSANLLESELFGHLKGSFTGAIRDKKGAIEMAEKGTLFLDEIDSIDLELQTKLLLFLDHLRYRPVGSEVEKKANVRIIVASGRSLDSLVRRGDLRKDFYFRIASGGRAYLPALREDKKLIKAHIHSYLKEHQLYAGKDVLDFYTKLSWPGNLRQLYLHLEQKKVLSKDGSLKLGDEDRRLATILPSSFPFGENEKIPDLHSIKKDYVWWVYLKYNENIEHSSKALSISKNTLKKLLDNKQLAA